MEKWSWGPGTIRRPAVYEQPSQKIKCAVSVSKTIYYQQLPQGAKTSEEAIGSHLSYGCHSTLTTCHSALTVPKPYDDQSYPPHHNA
jgi:hypothetical protein